jgi:hypothetical protein
VHIRHFTEVVAITCVLASDRPAMIGSCRVRQLVQLRFEFSIAR